MKLEELTKEKFEEIVLDYCNNRGICRELDIIYSRMNHEDIEKIRTYLRNFYLAGEDKHV